MSTHFLRTKIFAALLIVLFVITPVGLSISTGIQVHRVQAGVNLGELGKGFVTSAAACFATAFIMKYVSSLVAIIPSPTVPNGSAQIEVKKAIDCILYNVVNTIIEDMIKSITTWAQTGFEGNPVFVTQVDKYMLSVLDTVAGAWIEEQLPLLCSPFRLEIQLALMQSYQTSSGRAQGSCSLTGAVNNIDGFLNGNFYDGGWGGWIDLVGNPYSNPYGSYLEADMGLKLKLINAQGKQSKDILQGQGYLSKQVKDCYAEVNGEDVPITEEQYNNGEYPEGTNDVNCGEPRTVTPGSYIQEQVAKATSMNMDRLTFADELNEMITALVAYLVRDVLLGEKGLAGYDQADFAETSVYPELPSVDEIDIPGLDGGGESCSTGPYHQPENSGAAAQRNVKIDEAGVVVGPGDVAVEVALTAGAERDAGYSRIQVDFDTTIGVLSYTEESPSDFNGLFWMARGNKPTGGSSADRWGNNVIINVGYLASKNKVHAQHNMDYPDYGACGISETANIELIEGETYHATFVYNALNSDQSPGKIELKYRGTGSAQGKNFTLDLTGKAGGAVPFIDLDNIRSGGQVVSSGIKIVLGNGPTSDGWAVPGLGGWTYENVHVLVEPGEGSGGDDDDDGGGNNNTTAPTATLTASPSTVTSGSPTTLSWNSTNATSCTATSGSGFVTGGATSGTDTSDNLTGATTFGLRCTGAGGNATASVSVNTTALPQAARIFIDDRDTPNKNELYSESSSGTVTKISQTLGAEGDVFRFEITPDGQHVVYLADVQNDRAELFVVPSNGGTVIKISSPSVVFGNGTSSDVIRFTISPDGKHVAYTADTNEWTKYELYSVVTEGGTVARISHQIPFDYDIDDFKFSPNSQRVLYRAGRTSIGLWELYSTPTTKLSTTAGAKRISQEMSSGQNVPQNGFEVSCDNQTTYFLADLIGGALPLLYSTPTTGGVITEMGGGQLPGNICS